MRTDLAIVIPAYKSTFLAAALDSIAAQTCKDFTLYIGDDCSPHDLKSIVDRYTGKISLVYKRFDENLGGRDLVAQWERCVDMTQGEQWLWLFSDDDVMESNCVEEFCKCLKEHPHERFFHFNINEIDGEGRLIFQMKQWPERITAKEYLDEKVKGKVPTFVVEFIMSRNLFQEQGRFQNYDLAWGSDFITWLKFADGNGGIRTIPNARVSWRASNENISPNKNPEIVYRKMCSAFRSVKYVTDYARTHHFGKPWFYGRYALGEVRRNRHILSSEQLKSLSKEYNMVNGFHFPLSLMSKILFRK